MQLDHVVTNLLEKTWGDTRAGRFGSLRVHVAQLRKKLGADPGRPRPLTEPGVGYRLNLPDPT